MRANNVEVLITASEVGMQTTSITDLSGRRLLSRNSVVTEGYNQVGFSLPANIGSGLYLLQVGKRAPVKFVKD